MISERLKSNKKYYIVKVYPKLTPLGFFVGSKENSEHNPMKWRHITKKVLVFHLKVGWVFYC